MKVVVGFCVWLVGFMFALKILRAKNEKMTMAIQHTHS